MVTGPTEAKSANGRSQCDEPTATLSDHVDDAWRRRLISALRDGDQKQHGAVLSTDVASAFAEPRLGLIAQSTAETVAPPRVLTASAGQERMPAQSEARQTEAHETEASPPAPISSSTIRAGSQASITAAAGRVGRIITRAALVPAMKPRARRAGLAMAMLAGIVALVSASGLQSAIPPPTSPDLGTSLAGLSGMRQLGQNARSLHVEPVQGQATEAPLMAPVLVREGVAKRPPQTLAIPAHPSRPATVASNPAPTLRILNGPVARPLTGGVPTAPRLADDTSVGPRVAPVDRAGLARLVASVGPTADVPMVAARPASSAPAVPPAPVTEEAVAAVEDETAAEPHPAATASPATSPRLDQRGGPLQGPAHRQALVTRPPASSPALAGGARQGLTTAPPAASAGGFMAYLGSLVQQTPSVWTDPRRATP